MSQTAQQPTPQEAELQNPQAPQGSNIVNDPNASNDPDVLTIVYDKYMITLPRNEEEKRKVGKFLKNMINLELGEENHS